jgi:Zn-dependent M28 family amino/carboxypeptidase
MFESTVAPNSKWRMRILLMLLVLTVVGVLGRFLWITQMPLSSYAGALPPLTSEESELRDHLSAEVSYLSATIGDRSLPRPQSLQAASEYLSSSLRAQGYAVVESPYLVDGEKVSNLEVILAGTDSTAGQVIVGAHYDSVAGTVAANDNGTGVAAVLELARLMRQMKFRRTVRFVLFVNEEPPYFQTAKMGSRVFAHQLRQKGVPVSAMFSLETIGFYSDESGSQKYPPVLNLFYPSKGNFIAFAGNTQSRWLVRESIRDFRESIRFPSEGIAAPADWLGIGWSDQWSFWQEGYPGVMITDTAPFRYPYYHTRSDTVDKINFDRTARVVEGIRKVVEQLANKP